MPSGAWLYSYVFIWFLVIAEYIVVILLLRQVSALLGHWVRNDPDWGLPLGSLAPELPAIDAFGNRIPSGSVTRTKRVLFFLSSGCSACNETMMRVGPTSRIDGVEAVLVLQASAAKAKLFLAKHNVSDTDNVRVVVDPTGTISHSYKVSVVPFITVVNSEGRVGAKRAAVTLAEIGALIASADVMRTEAFAKGAVVAHGPRETDRARRP